MFMDSKISFPHTKKEPFCENKHGVTISDPYRWLEKEEDEEVAKLIQCQNAHTRSILDVIPSRDRIAKRIEEVYATGMRTVPVMRGGKFFFFKREPGEELLSLFVQEGEKTRLLIDAHTLSSDNTAVLKGFSPSWDGHLLAYQVSRAGNDQMEIALLDVRTGQLLEDRIPAEFYPSMHSGITWSRDNRGFWYTRRYPDAPVGEEKFHQKLYYHHLGISFIEDECLFVEKIGKEDNPSLSVCADGRFLLVPVWVSSRGKEQNDLWLYDYDHPEKGFYPIVENKDGLFFGHLHRDRLYIQTNYQAPFWRVFSVSLQEAHQGMKSWEETIPEGEHKIED